MISVTIPFTSPAERSKGRREEGGGRLTNQLPEVSTNRISGDPNVVHVQEGETKELRGRGVTSVGQRKGKERIQHFIKGFPILEHVVVARGGMLRESVSTKQREVLSGDQRQAKHLLSFTPRRSTRRSVRLIPTTAKG